MSRIHAHRLIESASVIENLLPLGNIPTSEQQTRELARVEPEQQPAIWQRAIETAPNGKVTAAHVRQVVSEMAAPEKAKEQGIQTLLFFVL